MTNASLREDDPKWVQYSEALYAGDHRRAVSLLEDMYAEGSNAVSFLIAALYEGGSEALPQDLDIARDWYQRAADIYLSPGYEGLGRLHMKHREYSLALRCFKMAHKIGSNLASNYIGQMYYYGLGVDRDFDLAKRYLEPLVPLRYVPAIFILARIARHEGRLAWSSVLTLLALWHRFWLRLSDPGSEKLVL